MNAVSTTIISVIAYTSRSCACLGQCPSADVKLTISLDVCPGWLSTLKLHWCNFPGRQETCLCRVTQPKLYLAQQASVANAQAH